MYLGERSLAAGDAAASCDSSFPAPTGNYGDNNLSIPYNLRHP